MSDLKSWRGQVEVHSILYQMDRTDLPNLIPSKGDKFRQVVQILFLFFFIFVQERPGKATNCHSEKLFTLPKLTLKVKRAFDGTVIFWT